MIVYIFFNLNLFVAGPINPKSRWYRSLGIDLKSYAFFINLRGKRVNCSNSYYTAKIASPEGK